MLTNRRMHWKLLRKRTIRIIEQETSILHLDNV